MPDNLPVITRPRDGAMVGGVCAGLARRWRVDPNLLRIAVVVLTVFGGLGLVAYGCGLLLMPRDGRTQPPVHRFLPFTRTWSAGTLVAVTIAAAVLVVAISGFNGIGIGPVGVIFLIWFFGFRGRNSRTPPAPPPEPTPFERAADNWRQRLVEQQAPGYENSPVAASSPVTSYPPAATPLTATAPPRWQQPYTDPATDLAVRDDDLPAPVAAPRRRTHRWRLWWLALTLVGAGVLTVTLLGLAGLPATPLAYAAAVLAGLGLTLLVGTGRGRPPLLLPATLITALVTGSLLVGALGLRIPEVGERKLAYTAGADLPPSLSLQAGEMTVDLSKLQLTGDQTVDLHVGTGQLNVILPNDSASTVVWAVKTGEFRVEDATVDEKDGVDLSGTRTYPAPNPGAPTLVVRASVDLGELDVKR